MNFENSVERNVGIRVTKKVQYQKLVKISK